MSTTIDYVEILNLYARYTHAIDGGLVQEWVNCFTKDGLFDRPRKKMSDKGTQQLTTFAEKHCNRPKTETEKHVTTNVLIDVQGDTATGKAYLNVVVDRSAKENQPRIRATGTYHDKLVKTPDGWRFVSRTLIHDGYMD